MSLWLGLRHFRGCQLHLLIHCLCLMTNQTVFSNTRSIQLRQTSGTTLDLRLVGETTNANDLATINHYANASSSSRSATAIGLANTHLITRHLQSIVLETKANATDASDWAYGLKDVQIEASRNVVPLNVNINVAGTVQRSSDPTRSFRTRTWSRRSFDPSYGFENSTLTTTNLNDTINIKVRGTAGNWSNQAVVYGLNIGNNKLDGINMNLRNAGSLRGRIRPSLETGSGDDVVSIEVSAVNNGSDYFNANSSRIEAGKQRAVCLNRTFVDLEDGNDYLTLASKVEITRNRWNSEFVVGASAVKANGFFGGQEYAEKNANAAASVDLYESGINAGLGNDSIQFFNGWSSDVWLGAGDDSLTLTAGQNLYIHGGVGRDTVKFVGPNADYVGFENNFHVVNTAEGKVFLDRDINHLFIDAQSVELQGVAPTPSNPPTNPSTPPNPPITGLLPLQPIGFEQLDPPEMPPFGSDRKFFDYVDRYPLTLKDAYMRQKRLGGIQNQTEWGRQHWFRGGLKSGRVLEYTNPLQDVNDYGAYVENYGTTLLDVYRSNPVSNPNSPVYKTLFQWGQFHFHNMGKSAGRQLNGGVDWGAIVKNEDNLFNRWQDARLKDPSISAFQFGYLNQNVVKSTLGVKVGSRSNDILEGRFVFGERGNDVIVGTDEDDILSGGFGDDLIVGKSGQDVVYGGPGRDVFRLRKGGTLNIRDFRRGSDLIQLDNDLADDASRITVVRSIGNMGSRLVYKNEILAHVFGVLPNDLTFALKSDGVENVLI